MPLSPHDEPVSSTVTLSSFAAEEIIALQSAEIARLRAEVSDLKAALAERKDGEHGPNLRAASWGILKSDGEHERISVGQPHTEQLLCPRSDGVRAEGSPYDPPRVKQGRRGVRDAIQEAVDKSKDECINEFRQEISQHFSQCEREHEALKRRLEITEAGLRKCREVLHGRHREKGSPVHTPEVGEAAESSCEDGLANEDMVIITAEECGSDSDAGLEDLIHIPSPGSSSAASTRIEQELLESSNHASNTIGTTTPDTHDAAESGRTTQNAARDLRTTVPVGGIVAWPLEEVFRPLPIKVATLTDHVLGRLKKECRSSGIFVMDSYVLCWEDYPYRLAWFVESATALRLASTTKPCTATSKRLPFRGPEALIAAFHGALYHFGTYSIRGKPEPLTHIDFERLPKETKKQIARQFVQYNPWWSPEYDAIIAEFELGTLTASKVFLQRVGFNDALDRALRALEAAEGVPTSVILSSR